MWITAAAKLRLIGNGATPALDTNVDTECGEVTLLGIVTSEPARVEAETETKAIDGVVGVRNELQVVPTGMREQVEAADSELESTIEAPIDDLYADEDADASSTPLGTPLGRIRAFP